MSVGQWSSSVDSWLALFVLLRVFSRLRAMEARCKICALVWTGTAEKGLRVVLSVGGGPQFGQGMVLPLVEVSREVSG
jgi:hypothetical protein